MHDNFDTAYEPKKLPFFVYDIDHDAAVAAGTFDECVGFIEAVKGNFDIRRNN